MRTLRERLKQWAEDATYIRIYLMIGRTPYSYNGFVQEVCEDHMVFKPVKTKEDAAVWTPSTALVFPLDDFIWMFEVLPEKAQERIIRGELFENV